MQIVAFKYQIIAERREKIIVWEAFCKHAVPDWDRTIFSQKSEKMAHSKRFLIFDTPFCCVNNKKAVSR